MTDPLAQFDLVDSRATLVLDDPDRRNAMSIAMFDAIDAALDRVVDEGAVTLLVRGRGEAFCAGFDLGAAAEDPALLSVFIERLGHVTRTLRRMPTVVVGAVHGAAIAGGCAMVSACDLVVVGPSTKLGYPVHPIGLSPAVTTPTLETSVLPGAARAILMGGELIDGREAHRLGLASHLAASDDTVGEEAEALVASLLEKGHHALRETKSWLNELDGSLDDARFDGPLRESADQCTEPASVELLLAFWERRRRR